MLSKSKLTLTMLMLVIVINIGVWLMGEYGIGAPIGSHVYGRYVDIVNEETPTSWYVGLLMSVGATIAAVVILYRNRE